MHLFKGPVCSPVRSYVRSSVLPYTYCRDYYPYTYYSSLYPCHVPTPCSSYYYPYVTAAAQASAASAAAASATATAAELSRDLARTVVRKNAEISDISSKYEKELSDLEQNLKKTDLEKSEIINELLFDLLLY